MTFLNTTLVLGIAAAAVPIVIHLMSRREPKRVVFPAVRFLAQRYEANRSKLRVRRWWLLALRAAALAALAIALARPVVHQSLSVTWLTIGLIAAFGVALLAMASVALVRGPGRSVAAGLSAAAALALLLAVLWGGYTAASGTRPRVRDTAPVALAIVLDNGPAVAWESGEDDRDERMRDLAAWVVSRAPPTSRIAVIDRSAVPAAFSLDAAGALSKLESVGPIQVPQPIAARIDAAIRLLRTSELENRRVLVISSLEESTWQTAPGGGDLASTLRGEPPVSLTVFDLGGFDATNRTLSLPTPADRTPASGTSTPVVSSVDLSSIAGGDELSVAVELQLFENVPGLPVIRDGETRRPPARQVDRRSVRVAAGGTGEVSLTVPPLEVGTHHAMVRLIGDDPLPLDDERYFTLRVLPPSPVLLVSSDEAEAKTFGYAITAPLRPDDPAAEFDVQRISYADLPVVQLGEFDAVLLLDPPASTLADSSLRRYVAEGGGLLVALGPSAGGERLQTALTSTLVRPWRRPEPGTFLEVVRPQHPVFAPFRELAGDARWSDFPVFRYWELEPTDTDNVLARFAGTGHPAVSERTEGDGRIVTVATPMPALAEATRGWNELFSGQDAWPAFVMVRQIVEQLTGRDRQPTSVPVGQPHPVPLPPRRSPAQREPTSGGRDSGTERRSASPPPRPRDSGAAGGSQPAGTQPAVGTPPEPGEIGTPDDRDAEAVGATIRYQLFPPGDRAPIPLIVDASDEVVTVTDVPAAGTYWLRGGRLKAGFSANLDPAATRLSRIDPAALDEWFGPDAYDRIMDRDRINLESGDATASVLLHSPAILLVLIVFLLEQILGNRFYRGAAPAGGGRRQEAVAA